MPAIMTAGKQNGQH